MWCAVGLADNPSDLYHQHGVREQVCTRAEYGSKTIVLHIKTRQDKFYCTQCKSDNVIRSGVVTRDFRSAPVGGKPVVLRMAVQRLECKCCHHVSQEHIHFAAPQTTYTRRLARYAVDLCRIASIKSVAAHLNLSWNTVKEMVKGYLDRNYSKPDISDLKMIGIDEFAVRKGHVYKTIVVDLETGRIVYVGEGKGADALDGFWKMVKKAGVKIEYVASDLSAAYISAVRENAPDAVYVFDHFHVVKLVNETLDKIRRRIVNQERRKEKMEEEELRKTAESSQETPDSPKRKTQPYPPAATPRRSSVVKGTKYILLRNREDLTDKKDIDRLNAALELNRDLSVAYYLKEDARLIWKCDSRQQAESQLDAWLVSALSANIPELAKLAETIKSHRTGILAYYCKPISTGPVEGINNKIKTLKRMAYGFRDEQYFTLRLLALHDFKYS